MEELKKIIEIKDEKLHMAATFGKQLLEDNRKLNEKLETQSSEHLRKVEVLEQEKYTLKMSLDLKQQIEESQTADIESLKEQVDNLTKSNRSLLERQKQYQQKISELTTEKSFLEEMQENNSKDLTKWKERTNLLENHLQLAQDQLNKSILNEPCSEEIGSMKKELQQLSVEKQQMECILSEKNCELESFRKQERKLVESLDNTREVLREKYSEIATYLKTIEQYKEEICELKLQEEAMKMGERDLNARGNSLFAEVDDRRKSVEKKLVSMRLKYDDAKEKVSFYAQQLNKLRYQMATLLSLASQNSDLAYIRNLEQSLEVTKQEIKELKQQLSEAEKTASHPQQPMDYILEDVSSGSFDYLKAMLKQSRKECEELKKKVQSAMLYKAAETDRAINSQQNLYQEQRKTRILQAEVVRLQTKLDELQKKDDAPIPKPVVEKLPDYEKENLCEQNHQPSSQKKVAISNDVIVNEADGQIVTDKLKDSNSKKQYCRVRKVEVPVIDMSKQVVNGCPQQ